MISELLFAAATSGPAIYCTPAEVREVIAYNYPRDKPQSSVVVGSWGVLLPYNHNYSDYKSPAQLRAEADRLEEEEKKAAEARKERDRIEALALKCMGWKPCTAWIGVEGRCVTEDDPEGKVSIGTGTTSTVVVPGGVRKDLP